MGFDAGKVVEPLDFDFTAFGGPKGIIGEPTDAAIDQLFKDVSKSGRTVLAKAGIDPSILQDIDGPEAALAMMADLPETATVGLKDVMSELAKAFAKACKGTPSATQIMQLPLRVRMRFFVWFVNEIRPEDFGAASMQNSNVRTLPVAKRA